MRIHNVNIKNFRLLADADLRLEEATTVIVGRNNSGKTSLSEVMRRLLTDGTPAFQLEDFSSASYSGFCAALEAKNAGAEEDAVRALIPAIELRMLCRYDPAQPEIGPLSPFIIDLDPACADALVVVRYELKDGGVSGFLDGMPATPLTDETRRTFFKLLRERLPAFFNAKIRAEDPNDPDNRRPIPGAALHNLIKTGFINAQRGLDDVTSRESDVLAKVLESLLSTANSATAGADDKAVAEALATAVQSIQTQIDTEFGGRLEQLMPTLKSFGYPGLGDQELRTETLLDVRRLMSNFTKVRYAGQDGVVLPESYNGLGVRNLIFILLQLAGFYKAFCAEETAPAVHLIFIEEPEAHLHPQMQEVFIRQLAKVAQKLVDGTQEKVPWPIQFVVSTHSSHIANEAGFESIRYFLASSVPGAALGVRHTKIKNLREGLVGISPENKNFLHQYLTLTRCDLFFADKAVLVEGLSERLLLPVVVAKLAEADAAVPSLASQYVTVMEVGGAYAHLFLGLLEFLELRSLIVTDIDSVEAAGGEACEVHLGTVSSNACLKSWFAGDELMALGVLAARTDADKSRGKNRIAYQCPEADGEPCGRTFEDAFILANAAKFDLAGQNANAREVEARKVAKRYKKSEFALHFAIEDTNWVTPKYLRDGVRWLAADLPAVPDPILALAVAVAAEAGAPEEAAK